MTPKLFFAHLPKTGGTTLTSLFNKDLNILDIGNLKKSSDPALQRYNLNVYFESDIVIHSPLHGNLNSYFGDNFIDILFQEPNIFLSSVRSPVSLLRSSWAYELQKSMTASDYHSFHLPIIPTLADWSKSKKLESTTALCDYSFNNNSTKITLEEFVQFLISKLNGFEELSFKNIQMKLNPGHRFLYSEDVKDKFWLQSNALTPLLGVSESLLPNVQYHYFVKYYTSEIFKFQPDITHSTFSAFIIPTEKLAFSLASLLHLSSELYKYFKPSLISEGRQLGQIESNIKFNTRNKTSTEFKDQTILSSLSQYQFNQLATKDVCLWMKAIEFAATLHNQLN